MKLPTISFALPSWIGRSMPSPEATFFSNEEKMRFAIGLSRLNVRNRTGGPFGAAIFDTQTGWLVAPGVNLVTTATCSVLHAEIVAIMMAQKITNSYDLGSGRSSYVLVSSCEPCAMCLGAIPWSGIREVIVGARDEDARAVGFDEGEKPADWMRALSSRGIKVTQDCCRSDAADVLKQYREKGGVIY